MSQHLKMFLKLIHHHGKRPIWLSMTLRLRAIRDVTCHMGSHSVTCLSTQVNALRLTPTMQASILDLPTPEGWKTELT